MRHGKRPWGWEWGGLTCGRTRGKEKGGEKKQPPPRRTLRTRSLRSRSERLLPGGDFLERLSENPRPHPHGSLRKYKHQKPHQPAPGCSQHPGKGKKQKGLSLAAGTRAGSAGGRLPRGHGLLNSGCPLGHLF